YTHGYSSFFFSSRRRHTRFSRDWSSDVCSSDLDVIVEPTAPHYQIEAESIDRSGFAIGSLHNEADPATHPIQLPTPRPRALLTMEDMGHGEPHDMSHTAHSSQTTQSATDTPKHDEHAQHDMHAGHSAIPKTNPSHPPVEGWVNMSTPAGHKALQY